MDTLYVHSDGILRARVKKPLYCPLDARLIKIDLSATTTA